MCLCVCVCVLCLVYSRSFKPARPCFMYSRCTRNKRTHTHRHETFNAVSPPHDHMCGRRFFSRIRHIARTIRKYLIAYRWLWSVASLDGPPSSARNGRACMGNGAAFRLRLPCVAPKRAPHIHIKAIKRPHEMARG